MVNPFRPYVEALEHAHTEDEFQRYQTEFDRHNRIIILGNGGSNSVASHISQDYMKFHQKAFQDSTYPLSLNLMSLRTDMCLISCL